MCQIQVTFAGFQLSSSGYKVDPSITEVISDYPTPTTQSDLRSFVGLVNQLSTSTYTLVTIPLRPLLSTQKKNFYGLVITKKPSLTSRHT